MRHRNTQAPPVRQPRGARPATDPNTPKLTAPVVAARARNAQPQVPSKTVVGGDGSEAVYSGHMSQLSPMAENGDNLQDAIVASPNTIANAGGEPVRTAVEPDELETNGTATFKRFVVDADKIVSQNGNRFTLRAGKIIDESNYNIDMLRRQGVKMHEASATD